jgi:N-acetylneuraminic acid mutarotase
LLSTVVAFLAFAGAAAGAGGWRTAAPLPVPRTEVAAARLGGEIVVVGGFTADGANSARVEAYSPARNHWRRLPNLPAAVDHAMAASYFGRLYVLGGYGADRQPRRAAYVFSHGRWKAIAPMPEARAAAGAAVVHRTLYVAGGRTVDGLARRMLALDLRTGRWRSLPGPTAREHLAVTGGGGCLYALAGRLAGADTNLRTFESYYPEDRRWRKLPDIPGARGGTAAAVVGRLVVSVGGEEPGGTIGSVYAYQTRSKRWRRLPDLPTPRHGLGLVPYRGKVYAVAGGPEPGLHVTGANEYLAPG